jgi:hypothetical protein
VWVFLEGLAAQLRAGFRPKRSTQMAIEAIRQQANRGGNWVLDADIEAHLDSIDPDALMAAVGRRVVDRQMLNRSKRRGKASPGQPASQRGSLTPPPDPVDVSANEGPIESTLVCGKRRQRAAARCLHSITR